MNEPLTFEEAWQRRGERSPVLVARAGAVSALAAKGMYGAGWMDAARRVLTAIAQGEDPEEVVVAMVAEVDGFWKAVGQ